MKYNLFIDDQINEINEDSGVAIRCPKIIDPSRDYIAFETVKDSISFIEENGCPYFISFDYDLGLDENNIPKESLELAKYLIEKDLDQNGTFIPKDFDYQVHSANIYAEDNLMILRNYLNQRK